MKQLHNLLDSSSCRFYDVDNDAFISVEDISKTFLNLGLHPESLNVSPEDLIEFCKTMKPTKKVYGHRGIYSGFFNHPSRMAMPLLHVCHLNSELCLQDSRFSVNLSDFIDLFQDVSLQDEALLELVRTIKGVSVIHVF